MLRGAIKNIKKTQIPVNGYIGNFETDIPLVTKGIKEPILMYLGSTFMNYESEEILKTLTNSAKKQTTYMSLRKNLTT